MHPSPLRVLSVLLAAFTIFSTEHHHAIAQPCEPWTVVDISGPSLRNYPAMAFDERRGVMVYFGGAGPFSGFGDTWERGDGPWVLRATSGPAPSDGNAMVYDNHRAVVVLFGRFNDGLSEQGQTWEWDGRNWAFRTSQGPSPRVNHAMTFDKRRGVVVLFGGDAASGQAGDTWEWDGNIWTRVSESGPSPRSVASMAYDPIRGVSVLHGGYLPSSETWEWDGVTWRFRGRFPTTIGSALGHLMVFDTHAGQTVSVSGDSEEAWAWDGASWRFLIRPLPYELSLGPQGIGYDHDRRVIMVVSGNGITRTTSVAEMPSCPLDQDGDDVPDPYDQCDDSDLRDTVLIDACDTDLTNHLFDDGCTMMDRIAECAVEARNHGHFVTCVGDLAQAWSDEGVLEQNEKGDLIHCAAQADAPLRRVNKLDRANPARVKPKPVEPFSQP